MVYKLVTERAKTHAAIYLEVLRTGIVDHAQVRNISREVQDMVRAGVIIRLSPGHYQVNQAAPTYIVPQGLYEDMQSLEWNRRLRARMRGMDEDKYIHKKNQPCQLRKREKRRQDIKLGAKNAGTREALREQSLERDEFIDMRDVLFGDTLERVKK